MLRDMQVMELLEEIRPDVTFAPDWDDVVRRSGAETRPARARPRRRRRLRVRRTAVLAFACLAAVAVAVAVSPAFGLGGKLLSFFSLAQSPHPERTWELAGPPERLTPELRARAKLTHVDPTTLRRIVAGGSGYRRLVLVGGIGPDGRPWLAQVSGSGASDFFPLFGEIGEVDRRVWHLRTAQGWDGWQFPMYGRSDASRALYSYLAFGGAVHGEITWATLVGFLRSDVARVVVVSADGASHTIAIAQGRGYAYDAVTPAGLPRQAIAYDADGHELGRESFHMDAVCPNDDEGGSEC